MYETIDRHLTDTIKFHLKIKCEDYVTFHHNCHLNEDIMEIIASLHRNFISLICIYRYKEPFYFYLHPLAGDSYSF